MEDKMLEFSNLLLKMSNTLLEHFKKYGINNSNYKSKEQTDEENDLFIEKFSNVDNSKVELVSSQKEQKSIIPLLIGGWILYKILK